MFKWKLEFKEERESIEDDVWCGRPVTKIMATMQKVRNLLENDRRFIVRTIAMPLETLKDSMHTTLKNVLTLARRS